MNAVAAMSEPHWIEVCRLDQIPLLGARVVQRPSGNVAVFRTADDAVFALADKCPHRGGPLSQGIVYGRQVACPLHNFQIRLSDGSAVAPDEGCTASYPIRVVAGMVQLNFDDAV